MILIPFGSGVLALEESQFKEALELGRELLPSDHSGAGRRLLDYDGLEAETGVPRSWWKDACRTGRVPCFRIGRYVRVDLNEALEAARGHKD